MIEGLDVSYYQGQIDWPQVAVAGRRFAIIRGGDGTFQDPLLEQNVAGALAAGLRVELYHYIRFSLSPLEMALECLRTQVRAIGAGLSAQARLWLDVEDTESPGSPEGRVSHLTELVGRLREAQVSLGIYSSAWYWKPYMQDAATFNYLPLWVATYFLSGQPSGAPFLFGGWQRWEVWQYSSTGRVPGIQGNVDLDIRQEEEMPDLQEQINRLKAHQEYWVRKLNAQFGIARAVYSGDPRQVIEAMKWWGWLPQEYPEGPEYPPPPSLG